MNKLSPALTLTGHGLVLREWTDDDLTTLVELFDDPDIASRTPLASPFDLVAARDYLDRARQARAELQRVQLAITTDGHKAKGEVQLNLARSTLSYGVGSAYRGQGLASRALRLMIEHAHKPLGFSRLMLEIEADNHPSIAVARATGFTLTDAAPDVVQGERRSYTLYTWALNLP
ncbi:GNAT family N-acetyltransferase [Actinomadura sp. 9N407]|uniref:GNAT family N-acetyltransferase n=1 Tax=Actinomadura sp. 9N407 TaxID=3375154 RepID=UPI0037A0D329